MMRRIGRGLMAIGLSAGAMVWAGCARMPTPPVGSAEAMASVVRAWTPTASGVYLDGAASRVFQHEDGSRSRRTVTTTDEGWRVEVVRLAGPGEGVSEPVPMRTVELVRLPADRGGIGLRAIEEHPERGRGGGSRVVFEPPIALLPPGVGEGETPPETVGATLTRGGGRPEQGQAVRTVRLGGTDRLPVFEGVTPEGRVGERLEATLDMRFGPVRIRRAEAVWAQAGVGIVGESSAVVVSYAGVPVDRRSSLAVVVEEIEGEAQPGN